MHFKKLELLGFKSFADKTIFHFEPGITAIVGPNGCGKSNIVDAIRWVLGEQSAKSLRGSRMEDVIFHGTETRKGAGMAEVHLTIDNSDHILPIDYSEITVTRGVFRSGESHYFINRTPCRLKDIENLFLDTGIGTRAYSILEQGKLDLILSAKPEDRRYVFEEAAGIMKFKERKRECLRKLEITEANLVRLADIIKEVQRQLNSIERQAAKAKRYKDMERQLKQKGFLFYKCQIQELNEEQNKWAAEKNGLEEVYTKLLEQITEWESQLTQLKARLREFDETYIRVQEDRLNIEKKLLNLNQQEDLNKNRIAELESRIKETYEQEQKSLGEIHQLRMQLEEVKKNLEETLHEKNTNKQSLMNKEKEISEIKSQINSLKKEYEEHKNNLIEHKAKEALLKNKLQDKEIQLKELYLKIRRMITECNKEKENITTLTQQIEKIKELVQIQQKSIMQLKLKYKEREEKLNILHEELEKYKRTFEEKNHIFSKKQSLYEILYKQKKEHEGIKTGIKILLSNREEYSGVIDILGNLLKIQPEYSDLLPKILGPMWDWVVVDSTETAIRLLKQIGNDPLKEVIFLPLDIPYINTHEKNPYSAEQPFPFKLIPVSSIIETDPLYDKMVKTLLKSYYLIDTEELDKIHQLKEHLWNYLGTYWKIFTKDGFYMDSIGVTGRPSEDKALKESIHRDQQIAELKTLLSNLSEEILSLTGRIRSINDRVSQEEKDLETLRNTIYGEELNLSIQESELMKLIQTQQEIEEKIKVTETEIDELKAQQETLSEEINKDKVELNKLHTHITYIENQQDNELNAKLSNLNTTLSTLEKEHTELKIRLITTEEKENHLVYKEGTITNQIQKLEESIQTAKQNIKTWKEEKVFLTEGIERIKASLQEVIKERDLLDDKYNNLRRERDLLQEEIDSIEEKLNNERGILDKTRIKLNEYELKLQSLNIQVENLEQKRLELRLSEEDIKEIENTDISSVNLDLLEQEIVTLRERLSSMGNVNLVAIEEQEELQKRFQFLTTQREDLVKAKDTLLKTIAKINATTKKMFWETFQQIRANFSEIFQKLFGGGKADLILLDEKDILESGIEIIARPPGKRLQNISLLSGGEKALTAVALIFAIFKVKPSPFCILDEIDAPLDEANIGRFIEMLKEFLPTTQFIIITHNKKTISSADTLYGITMEGKGISKLISVKLSSKEKTST